jgi:tRNA(adenine34) deaminase
MPSSATLDDRLCPLRFADAPLVDRRDGDPRRLPHGLNGDRGHEALVSDEELMRLALTAAASAPEHDDVPIGAVLARDGRPLATAVNERELRRDPTAHAEILALREGAEVVGGWRLPDTTLYVTLEPCAMCAGAIVLARVPRVVYAAPDPKAGAAGSVLDVLGEPRLNHRPEVVAGVLADEAGEMLRAFFRERR